MPACRLSALARALGASTAPMPRLSRLARDVALWLRAPAGRRPDWRLR